MQCVAPVASLPGARGLAFGASHRKICFSVNGRPVKQRANLSVRSTAESSGETQYKDGVRCYMTKEGALVCERLPAGNYRLEAAAPRTHDETGALADAPRCDPTRPEECLTYCYVMEDGSMVCEGLPTGEYQIKTAGPEDVERMVQHALALEKGATYKDLTPAAAQPKEENSGLLGKIMGIFRSS
ncbi:hypothetical protein COCOBI_11-1960 [Coccomyxa sp. Obi]|nr:hypothetical protein COCOBI_11-1960 [Coccomyxa sp. Obi]